MAITRVFNIAEEDDSYAVQLDQIKSPRPLEEKYDLELPEKRPDEYIICWLENIPKKGEKKQSKVHFNISGGTKHALTETPISRKKKKPETKLEKLQKLKLKLPNYKRGACRPGIPVAPRALRFEMKDGYDDSHKTLLLRWWPSQIFDENGGPCQTQKIVGYRIYVNGHPKGMIKAHKNRALVEGLRVQHEYKITVVAMGTIGESAHSNAAIIYVPNSEVMGDKYKTEISGNQTEKTANDGIINRLSAAPREVESIDHIIEEVRQKCSNNKALLQKVAENKPVNIGDTQVSGDAHGVNAYFTSCEKEGKIENKSDPPSEAPNDIEKSESKQSLESDDSEDYNDLLEKLDDETDDDVIERVLKRYGLNGDDFNYAKPSQECSLTEGMCHKSFNEVSLD